MIHYFIQIIAFQLLFLIVYDLFLKKETFFNWNRAYLLLTPLISLLLPFIQIEGVRQSIPEPYLVQLPAVVLGGNGISQTTYNDSLWSFSWQSFWYAGMLLSALYFVFKFIRLKHLTKNSVQISKDDYVLRILPNSKAAFTFLNTIYLGENLSEEQKGQILSHEEIHVRKWHSLDLIFFELLRIVFWFNPLLYIFQARIGAVHEYEADREVVGMERNKYYESLLSQVFQTNSVSFINTFFNHSLIKNRILMLQRSNSKRILGLKYLLIVPIICTMLVYTSCAQETTNSNSETAVDLKEQSESEILQQIEELQAKIAAKGEISPEEAIALRALLLANKKHTDHEGHDMHFDEKTSNGGMAFAAIDKVPVYPGCEGLSSDAAKKCFTEKVATFIVDNFNTEKFSKEAVSGRQRIAVHFTISDTGTIGNVKAKADFAPFIAEAERVVKQLPRMTPGEHQGKKVNVQFAVPIIFEME